MKTADQAITFAGSDAPTGKMIEMSRRGVIGAALGAGAAASAAALVPAAAARAAVDPDALFWRRYYRIRRFNEWWAAAKGQSDAERDRWSEVGLRMEAQLMAMPARDVSMIAAKWAVCNGDDVAYDRFGKSWTSLQVIGWDLERISNPMKVYGWTPITTGSQVLS